MDKQRTSSAPLVIALGLLILPVLYVGSYLALVEPGNYATRSVSDGRIRRYVLGYRCYWDNDSFAAKVPPVVFWPLEQIDRRVRPGRWNGDF